MSDITWMHNSAAAKYRGPLLILLASLCFSTTGTSQQAFAPPEASPLMIGAIRLWLGGLFMFLWCRLTRKLPTKKGWPPVRTFLSAMGILFFQLAFFAAVASTGVAIGTVVTCGSLPLGAGLLAFIFLKEKPRRIWYLATAVAILGLCLLSLTGGVETNPVGLLLALVSGSSYAVYLTFGKTLSETHPPETVIMVLFGIGAILISPVFFIYPTAWLATPKGMALCLHLGLITAAAGYTIYLAGAKITPVSTTATLTLSESLLAACWGLFLLNEQIGAQQLVGLVLLFLSTVVLVVRPK